MSLRERFKVLNQPIICTLGLYTATCTILTSGIYTATSQSCVHVYIIPQLTAFGVGRRSKKNEVHNPRERIQEQGGVAACLACKIRRDLQRQEVCSGAREPAHQTISQGAQRDRDVHWGQALVHRGGLQFRTQRSRLYPDNVRDLECAKSATDVFIDNASIGFGSLFGGRVPKHLKKCVFFQDKNVPHKFRTVNAQLKDNDLKRDTKTAVTAWLRRAIQGQIDTFRTICRKSDNYKCFLCACELAGQENHVDHGVGTDSFKSIAERFQCAQKSTPLELGELGGNLTMQWRRFHKKNANLTMTCRPCNPTNKWVILVK